ncbi:MAG: hypothetical protein LQ338_002662 [Usnochroma carphineum]|nr:MAG: hypothetical protein LQ338_002662 [Usnochroma carphineum]
MVAMSTPSCPFCPFSDHSPYFLAQHIEAIHPEPDEPSFVSRHFLEDKTLMDVIRKEATTVEDAPSQDYIDCECGEAVLLGEFDDHVQLHSAESADMAVDTSQLPAGVTLSPPQQRLTRPPTAPPLRSVVLNAIPAVAKVAESPGYHHGTRPSKRKHDLHDKHGDKQDKQQHTVKEWIDLLLGSNASPSRANVHAPSAKDVKRLGKAELGPYAHEDQMPAWLYRQLERGAKVSIVNQIGQGGRLVRLEVVANETRGILPVVAQLCEQDHTLSKVYLCHPGVQHIFKMAKEGGFCGYRNIQMMVRISYIQAARAQGYEYFPGRVPSILDVQELIESAWDRGINAAGRVETGGIRGTRKYIGTPEAQTLLLSLKIGCEASAFNDANSPPAFKKVYDYVERYFVSHTSPSPKKVCRTSLPPVYFQHQGHSLTIIGLEIRKSGSRNLLVFDPSFKPSPGIQRLIGNKFGALAPEKLLKAYRRGDNYLSKHSSFEILK